MQAHPSHPAPDTSATAAELLGGLWRDLGEQASTAAGVIPGVGAAVDQHAAAIRDALSAGAGVIGPVALASYASGLREVATEQGWELPAAVTWPEAGWQEIRLAAVCLLARQLGHV
ncbi:DUF6401 family natural product biosynthesis protein [Longispora albida]|uniref:DUF6401 family natural product biosynthesis protein n=1 Tax=Longispora albida TaxID=203523 RepID=UPI0003A6898F|nr:DUF6401 family natural product biosynthesis protein [Longispora albida]